MVIHKKTHVCVKCGAENYCKDDKSACIIKGCQGVLEKANLFECKSCAGVMVASTENYLKCSYCGESMEQI